MKVLVSKTLQLSVCFLQGQVQFRSINGLLNNLRLCRCFHLYDRCENGSSNIYQLIVSSMALNPFSFILLYLFYSAHSVISYRRQRGVFIFWKPLTGSVPLHSVFSGHSQVTWTNSNKIRWNTCPNVHINKHNLIPLQCISIHLLYFHCFTPLV